MADGWIHGCGVRFFGASQVTEGIVIGWSAGVCFGLVGLMCLGIGFREVFAGDGLDMRALGLVMAAIGVFGLVIGYTMISDAVCYAGIPVTP